MEPSQEVTAAGVPSMTPAIAAPFEPAENWSLLKLDAEERRVADVDRESWPGRPRSGQRS